MRMLRTAAVAALLLLCACEARESLADRGAATRPIRTDELGQVALGRTTPADVEQLFGAPVERLADGTLAYRWAVGPAEEGRVKFEFVGGTLSKICQDRRT